MLAGVSVLLLMLLAGRAAFLGTVRAGDLAARGKDHSRFAVDLIAQRGSIVAANGTDLATDQLAVNITATPNLITDPQAVAARLGPILRRDPNTLANILSRRGQYAMLARNVAPAAADRVRALGIPGLDFTDTYQRVLPGGPQAAQLVGLTGDEHQGLTGLELQLNKVLTGTPGRRVEVRDLFGRPIQVLGDREPTPGKDVALTLDPRIQEQTQAILASTRQRFGAKTAMAIVMRPSDGAILAMATVPSFNPNDRRTLNPELERNRPVIDAFEPGSTFKIVTMTAALEDGKVTPQTSFLVPGQISLYRGQVTLRDSHDHPAEMLTATQILEQSSNVGVYKIALEVGKERLLTWIRQFGFGRPTGIGYPGEVGGYVRPGDQWYGSGITNIPIGQGLSITLTQLARAYAAIANGGRLVQPYLVSTIGGTPVAPRPGRRIMRAATAREIDAMLRRVVSTDGTGTLAQIPGVQVAGKTGTAQKIDHATGRYTGKYTSSFVGYVPANRPQFLIAVVVDEPTKTSYYGGDVAAPAFQRIAEFSLQTRRITP